MGCSYGFGASRAVGIHFTLHALERGSFHLWTMIPKWPVNQKDSLTSL